MADQFEVRLITENDAQAVLDIYAPYVRDTIISFEYEVPTLEDFALRIKTNITEYPWLVCLQNDKITGYAYASKHRYRTAYQWSPEVSIYLSEEIHGKGIARVLYEALFSILQLQGYFNMFAGIGMPNEKSEGFHKALGFEEIGVFKKIGYKFGNWHDTKWFQRYLAEHIQEPTTPVKITDIENSAEVQLIINKANERLADL
ncbi:MAG: GNAT family N-acetyltransferase [Flavipsychrobacter sp.]|nr:GNAT family N-acetyltransferase [Flavipsychrobacter sp.]